MRNILTGAESATAADDLPSALEAPPSLQSSPAADDVIADDTSAPRGGGGEDFEYETDVTESELALSTACSSTTSMHDDVRKSDLNDNDEDDI